ncbi:squalene-hopene cyclase [Planctopirus limnophila DSM 3776]|uniref:Squalene-hopene cyclase n=1 Tax=Planctopirus limnophila (strain ATCC 43296 / DSM 3776 / IFAM 1008 / Mu 290) TaxID=521674 RepID=D5SYK6_PLAL2|nr:terpene cyclase/mutase family protein [Planctopirus limnophila]ADG67734.1 squalene-hopene cyclase [Planctopirus limnophila DSM 3776]
MTSGTFGAKRVDLLAAFEHSAPAEKTRETCVGLQTAIARTRQYLLDQQHSEGFFVAELEGDTILESEYILLLAFLNEGQSPDAQAAARYLLTKQNTDGSWSNFPGGPIDVSCAVKAYLALRITGHAADEPALIRAREAILQAGGVERVNSFTRFYLAMLGLIPYSLCPAVPPEVVLLPDWFPINLSQMSAWSRTIVVPLSLLWAFQPAVELNDADGHQITIEELYASPEKQLPRFIRGVNHESNSNGWMNWSRFFFRVDQCLKSIESYGIKPLRSRAVRKCVQWILDRQEMSDGLGAIFPPIVWTLIGLKCAGFDDQHPMVQKQRDELNRLMLREQDALRLQPCLSPVWDTAISIIALRESGVEPDHPALSKARNWLLSKEVRHAGDWSKAHPETPVSGWYFEFNNEFYPDVDDTAMVLIALASTLPEEATPLAISHGVLPVQTGWSAESTSRVQALKQLENHRPVLEAMGRGVQWLKALQSKDGGWGAFDSDINKELLTKVPFADHNAMLDETNADISARVLEAYAAVGISFNDPSVQRALEFIWNDQEDDHAWYGRWGVNYIYGTWQVLVGLTAIGISAHDPRLVRAAGWLKSKQQACGGWGETPATYDNPTLRGQGTPTASQTAWAVLGLIAAGEQNSIECQRGVEFLLKTQKHNGTWDEEEFTGTGFPRVFYLRYHYYPLYFPLMALGRFARAGGRVNFAG